MPFALELSFLSEHALHDFSGSLLPRLPGVKVVDKPLSETASAADADPSKTADVGAIEPETLRHDASAFGFPLHVTVSSPSTARELCHQLVGFELHQKQSGVLLEWMSGDGEQQAVQLFSGGQREAEVIAKRLGAAVKVHNDLARATQTSE